MIWWQNFWYKIITPSDRIRSQYDREQASLYATTIFVVIIFVMLLSVFGFAFGAVDSKFIPVIGSSLIFYVGLYTLSRSLYFRWSARLFLWIVISFIFYVAVYLVPDKSLSVLNYLVIPILISSFILPNREAILNVLLVVLFITIFKSTNPDFTDSPYAMNMLVILIGSISSVASKLIERYRRQAIDNENRFQSLMQANQEGILFIDSETAQILDANPATEQIFGLPPEEIIGHYPIDFVIPGNKALIRNLWEHRTKNIPIELQIMHKEGYELSVEARLRPHYYDDKNTYVLTIIDISDRKQAEAFIVESETRFRAIFNESIHYIAVLDGKGKIIEFNDRSYDTFGLDAHHMIGEYIYDFENWAQSEEAKAKLKEVIEKASLGEASRYDMQVRDKDNQTVYLDFSLKPILDSSGNIDMIIAESRDITEQRLAERKRREFEQRYETLFNNTTDAVFIFDMKGCIRDANRQAERMLGSSREEIIGSYIFDFVSDEDIDNSTEILNMMRDGKQVSNVSERRMRRATGELFFAETLGLLVRDEQGKPDYIQSMVRDISERKKIEAERFKAALESERTQLLAHFIENASHHFRTPITNMKTRMYLLPRILDNPDKRDESIDILNQNLQRLQNILNDLLMVLRLQKDDTEYEAQKIPVKLLLSEVKHNFEGRDNYQNYDWLWQLDPQNSPVFVDKGLLAQALINIIENAIIYTPEGGKITINNYRHDAYVVFDIIDEGRGINDEELPRIFEDFFRGQESMQENTTRSGLGLSIVRMIIDRYQGKIFAGSSEKGGAHFQIILPSYVEDEADLPEMPSEMLK